MPDDTRKKPPPLPPFGIPIGRPITERGGGSGSMARDRRHEIIPPDNVRSQLEIGRPMFDKDDLTGQFHGEELARARATLRTPDERLAILEEKTDSLVKNQDALREDVSGIRDDVGEMKMSVGELVGQSKLIPDVMEAMRDATRTLQQRDHYTFTAKVDVDKAKQMADITMEQAEDKDVVDARKARREWITKALGIIAALVALVSTMIAVGRC